ncbi:MAG TPA: hypothetical protein VFZ34_02070 [Blastocatellia bacterium]|nr:hypothetical protein [Blastocatellia bacterium]
MNYEPPNSSLRKGFTPSRPLSLSLPLLFGERVLIAKDGRFAGCWLLLVLPNTDAEQAERDNTKNKIQHTSLV